LEKRKNGEKKRKKKKKKGKRKGGPSKKKKQIGGIRKKTKTRSRRGAGAISIVRSKTNQEFAKFFFRIIKTLFGPHWKGGEQRCSLAPCLEGQARLANPHAEGFARENERGRETEKAGPAKGGDFLRMGYFVGSGIFHRSKDESATGRLFIWLVVVRLAVIGE